MHSAKKNVSRDITCVHNNKREGTTNISTDYGDVKFLTQTNPLLHQGSIIIKILIRILNTLKYFLLPIEFPTHQLSAFWIIFQKKRASLFFFFFNFIFLPQSFMFCFYVIFFSAQLFSLCH